MTSGDAGGTVGENRLLALINAILNWLECPSIVHRHERMIHPN